MNQFARRQLKRRGFNRLRLERLEDRRLLAGIKGFVWNDWNRDGRAADEKKEHVVSDVRVQLLDANTGDVILAKETDRDGKYEFPEIDPGDFIIEFIPKDDFDFTRPDVGSEKKDSDALPATGRTKRISVREQDNVTGVNAGIFSPVAAQSIHGRVWNDVNRNGIQDLGEPGVAGFEVQVENLYENRLYEVDTDSNGRFEFDGAKLLPGDYQLEFRGLEKNPWLEWRASPAHARDGSAPHEDSDLEVDFRTRDFAIRALSDDVSNSVAFDAGVFESSQVVGTIWNDLDRNGSFGEGESGVERYTVNLLNANGDIVQQTLSDLHGVFQFNVNRGDFMIEVETPDGVRITRNDAPADGTESGVDPETGRSDLFSIDGNAAVRNVSVGVTSKGTRDIIGRVWHDINANGIQDQDEPGFDDAKVELENSSFFELFETRTNQNGFFTIPGSLLLPGSTYHVHYKKPEAGMRVGPRNANSNVATNSDNDAQPTNRRSAPIELSPIELAEVSGPLRQDAGFYLPTTIQGGIWDDENGNGLRDATEKTVPGVTVELLRAESNVVATVTTNIDGLYEFEDITPGTDYRVRVASLPNMTFTRSVSGPTNRVSSIQASTGMSIPFAVGSKRSRELWAGIAGTSGETGIQGSVWDDENGNGIRDKGETGLSGVHVKAYGMGRTYETVSDDDGVYRLTALRPGQYKLEFQQPDGATFSPLHRGDDSSVNSDVNRWSNQTSLVPVVTGQLHDTIDAGVYRGPIGANALESIRLTEIASIAHGEIEFVEITNIGSEPVDLDGIRFIDGVRYNFSSSKTTSLFPGEYAVLYGDEHDPKNWDRRNEINIVGQYAGDLNQEERLTLVDSHNRTIASVAYDDDWFVITDDEYLPWTLTAIDETASREMFSSVLNWRPSSRHGGSPGTSDPGLTPNPGAVVINEVLTKSSDEFNDLIELYNTTDSDIDIGYWFLGDYEGNGKGTTDVDPTDTLTRYRIAPGTVIPAGGYVTFTREDNFASESDLGTNSQFGLSSYGESLHLVAADEYGTMLGYSNSVEFAGTDIDVAYGRVELSNGGSSFLVMSEPTFGGPNSAPAFSPVLIDQVMYSTDDAIPYVRLQNVSDADIESWLDANHNRWSIDGTISYDFKRDDVALAAGGFAFVVPTSPELFREHYAIPSDIPVYGPYQKSLGRRQGVVSLYQPGLENRRMLADQIEYQEYAPWPTLKRDVALTRRSGTMVGSDPAAWIDSEIVTEPADLRHQGENRFFVNAFRTNAAETIDHDALSVAVQAVQPGDANGDGVFNSRDFVHVFQAAKYNSHEFASWTEGDWNLDGVFDSSDFVAAFTLGLYEQV
ncbi:SdrD B-like domain-containing protein [Planctomycetota bacterium]